LEGEDSAEAAVLAAEASVVAEALEAAAQAEDFKTKNAVIINGCIFLSSFLKFYLQKSLHQ
jgi:hypothetical protein